MLKRLTITGSTLRASPAPRKAMLASELREKVWPLLAEHKLRSVIHATFDLAAAPDAHALMESSKHIGKIMLAVKGG
jgi:NADPH:quinone reductase-like Zn-dependent oxidoreductase